jgi:CubicO group peptidase (beta-lactamase class C family)
MILKSVSNYRQRLYKKGFGYADLSKKELAKPDTKFRIGSITKQFTAAAVRLRLRVRPARPC